MNPRHHQTAQETLAWFRITSIVGRQSGKLRMLSLSHLCGPRHAVIVLRDQLLRCRDARMCVGQLVPSNPLWPPIWWASIFASTSVVANLGAQHSFSSSSSTSTSWSIPSNASGIRICWEISPLFPLCAKASCAEPMETCGVHRA